MIKKITIKANDKDIELTLEEAQSLKRELDQLFGKTEYVPYTPHIPYVPSDPYKPYRPFWYEITCDNGSRGNIAITC